MFNNAPTVVFIANDPAYDMSQIDCGLLGENMILSAWSMGIGSCCLGGPVRFMKSPAAAEYMKQLGFSEGHSGPEAQLRWHWDKVHGLSGYG